MPILSTFSLQPLPTEADAVIIGAGIQGCAAAYYLAKRGLKVVVLEKSRIAGQQSGRAWGFVRAMDRDPAETPLMIAGLKLWQGLEAELGQDIEWRQEGNLFLARDEAELARFEIGAARDRIFGIDAKVISSREVSALIPGLVDPGPGGLWGPKEGQAEPRKTSPALARKATDLGALFFEGCGAVAIDRQAGAVSAVVSEAGTIRTRNVVLAAGASSFRVMKSLGLFLPQQLARFTCSRTNPLPALSRIAFYGHHIGFRQRSDGSLNLAEELKVDVDITLDRFRALGSFLPSLWDNRDATALCVNEVTIRDLLHRLPWRPEARQKWIHDRDPIIPPNMKRVRNAVAQLGRLFPTAVGVQAIESWAGNVDLMPDGIPVLGPVAEVPGLVLATGLTGHGFGMGPIVGKLTSEIIVDGKPSLDLNAFRFARFAEGKIGRSSTRY
ncbi:NAD(P)/FAD-dependent oxidoreductase [Dongia rigui]|uniref:FAD-binding oxidoreductase n=1 Tax=Dongia rigui TaxID=940149 RepID=A0ABU5E5P2_9PROT|nr:FAD-binding oxidoreductase [Dongia rigui]MDY0874201.1 FAD-binding oxidoreductase [Dongia rigui]